MYKTFVSETAASLFTVGNRTRTPGISVSDGEEYSDMDNTNMDTNLSKTENDSVKSAAVSEVSKVNQQLSIMEKIHSFQNHLSELTTLVNINSARNVRHEHTSACKPVLHQYSAGYY